MTALNTDALPSRRRFAIKNNWLRKAPFPLALAAFAAVGVSYINIVFTPSTRWIFLALLAGSLALSGRIFSGLKGGFGIPLVAYFGWCMGTTAWSQVPQLSFPKSAAMVLTVVALLSGGYYWAINSRPEKTFTYLIPIVLLALLSGIGGRSSAMYQGFYIYEGLAGNPNFLGMLVAIAFPYVLILGYRAVFGGNAARFAGGLSLVLAGLLCVLLWRSGSRASMLCVLVTVFFSVLWLTASKKAALSLIVCFGVVSAVVILPRLQSSIYERVVLKGRTDGKIFFSRREPWEESYRAALEGGYLGVGYGVSAGDTQFSFGLTAIGYGREKSNSQLAVWEETGLIGLALYAILLFGIFKRLYVGIRTARDRELKVKLSIMFGLAMGLIAQSAFEAWWTSPGSLESAAFWSTVGIGTGLVKRAIVSRSRGAMAMEAAAVPATVERGYVPRRVHY